MRHADPAVDRQQFGALAGAIDPLLGPDDPVFVKRKDGHTRTAFDDLDDARLVDTVYPARARQSGAGIWLVPEGDAEPGDILVSGGTESADIPVTADALQPQLAGWSDFFLSRLDPGLGELRYSTFLGGTSKDVARSLVAQDDTIAVVGATMPCNFPLADPFRERIGGAWNARLVRLRATGPYRDRGSQQC